MSENLFPNFLSDPNQHRMAILFWEQLVRGALKERFDKEGWTHWFNTTFDDGTPIGDSSPFVSYVSKLRNRGISIFQVPHGQSDEIDASIRVFALGDPEETPYLEICLCLTSNTSETAKQLIKAWVEFDGIYSEFNCTP